MTPASNSEARKRAETRPADVADPVEALRVLADEILHEDLTDSSVTAWRSWIAGRLVALIGEVVPRPPLVSEVINHLGVVELQAPGSGAWKPIDIDHTVWAEWLATYGDHFVYSYRLAPPPPKPTTERVPLHRVPGRTLPGQEDAVIDIYVNRDPRDGVVTAWGRLLAVGHQEVRIPVAEDGTVEVLVEVDR